MTFYCWMGSGKAGIGATGCSAGGRAPRGGGCCLFRYWRAVAGRCCSGTGVGTGSWTPSGCPPAVASVPVQEPVAASISWVPRSFFSTLTGGSVVTRLLIVVFASFSFCSSGNC